MIATVFGSSEADPRGYDLRQRLFCLRRGVAEVWKTYLKQRAVIRSE